MVDDVDRLSGDARLAELLAHYANLGKPDRNVWQHRVMEMEGLEQKELSWLHGELIAFDLIEQNTGHMSSDAEPGGPRCYRVTLHGLRVMARLHGTEHEESASAPCDSDRVKPSRRQKPRTEALQPTEADPTGQPAAAA